MTGNMSLHVTVQGTITQLLLAMVRTTTAECLIPDSLKCHELKMCPATLQPAPAKLGCWTISKERCGAKYCLEGSVCSARRATGGQAGSQLVDKREELVGGRLAECICHLCIDLRCLAEGEPELTQPEDCLQVVQLTCQQAPALCKQSEVAIYALGLVLRGRQSSSAPEVCSEGHLIPMRHVCRFDAVMCNISNNNCDIKCPSDKELKSPSNKIRS